MCEVYLNVVHEFSTRELSMLFGGEFARALGISHVSCLLVDSIRSRFGSAVYTKTNRTAKFEGVQFLYTWVPSFPPRAVSEARSQE